MTSSDFCSLLQGLADGWQSRDYARVARSYTEDVQYKDPTRYHFTSRGDLQKFFEDDGGLPQSTVWHTIVFDEAQQVGAAEYTYTGHHQYHGTVLIKVANGRITHWREYQHIDPRPWENFVGTSRFA